MFRDLVAGFCDEQRAVLIEEMDGAHLVLLAHQGDRLADETVGLLDEIVEQGVDIMRDAGRQKGTYDDYVQKSIEYISSQYSYHITVEEIAQYAGVSRSHLFRAFQSCLGQSPKEYLTEYRIQQACRLLKETGLSVSAIAYSVGFENNLYFSKAFRKVKKTSPTEYREKHRKKKE